MSRSQTAGRVAAVRGVVSEEEFGVVGGRQVSREGKEDQPRGL